MKQMSYEIDTTLRCPSSEKSSGAKVTFAEDSRRSVSDDAAEGEFPGRHEVYQRTLMPGGFEKGVNPEDVEAVKHAILQGNLSVHVFKQNLETEVKSLKLDIERRLITIQGGQSTGEFNVGDLQCIVQGIGSTIIRNPPPADRAVAFKLGQESHLCVLFDDAHICRLAVIAFSQLCNVPVYPDGASPF
eukprot:NODE_7241_length_1596_cov_14.560926.p2 GENE.NODE_7241_length_1596_cov_14.560926~~NODE_7241_length_1596_cov_14.560926.p2  ORF type:complete len:188 (+),score=55.24 NODE_7241_length_1596_cov_14.560926:632-1195(+)